MIVLDSSAAIDYLLRAAPRSNWVEERLDESDWDLHAPHLLDVEVAGALRRLARAGTISARRGGVALKTLGELTLTRYPHVQLLERIWQLRAAFTAPDAAFVALAEALDADLVTTDARLARAPGSRARILAP